MNDPSSAAWGSIVSKALTEIRLTPREHTVLTLIAAGATNGKIADELELSSETVRTHVRNAMRKLGAHTRAQAIARASRERILDS